MAVVLGAALCVGLWASPDYGLAWDEPIQQRLGVQASRYAAGLAEGYLRNPDRIYGPAFEVALYAAERVVGAEDSRSRYLLRHALTFLTFWCGTLAFYALARRSFGWRFGLLATLLLLLSPRLVADAFYNSKDLPFLSFFVVAILTLLRFVEEPTPSRALVHAFACAVATDVRMMGVLLIPLTLLAAAVARREGTPRPAPQRRSWLSSALLGMGYVGTVVLLWPYLWHEPARRFGEAFLTMARFPWQETVLFMGVRTPAPALPWFYLPVWIGITTPPAVLFFTAVGALVALKDLRARRGSGAGAAVILAWAFLPLVTVIALRSVLYDGWRQMYFVYPALVLLAVAGVRAAWRVANDGQRALWRRSIAGGLLTLLAADIAVTAHFLIRSHPYQHVYFNALAGARASLPERFEVDYWGLSSRRLLEYVVETDRRPEVAVFGVEPSVAGSAAILRGDERRRLRFVPDAQHADYVVTHYRYAAAAPPGEGVFSVRVDGMRLGSVFRVPRSEALVSQP